MSRIRYNSLLTEEQEEKFIGFIPGHTYHECAEYLSEILGRTITDSQARSWIKNRNLRTGTQKVFEKGHVPWSKGKSPYDYLEGEARERWMERLFKPGHVPVNKCEVGTVLVKNDGYMWIKVADNPKAKLQDNWQQYQRYLWEKEHGKIPDGKLIIFKDGNPLNCRIENLEMVSLEEHGTLNISGVKSTGNPDLVEAKILVERIKKEASKNE